MLPPPEKTEGSAQQDSSQSVQEIPGSAGAGGEKGRASGSEGEESEVCMLREQISTLTKSMAALTEQKAEMEARFQADKKKAMVNAQLKMQLCVCVSLTVSTQAVVVL